MKNFIAINKDGNEFKYLKEVFTKFRDAKIRNARIRELIDYVHFAEMLKRQEIRTRSSFVSVVRGSWVAMKTMKH